MIASLIVLSINGAGPPSSNASPNDHAKMAASWLSVMADDVRKQLQGKGIKDDELTYEYIAQKYLYDIRFISFYAIDNDTELAYTIRETWFVMASASRASSFKPPREVPGSQGRLFYFKLDDYAWNAGAWEAVVNRAPFFREPDIEHRHAEFLRRTLGTIGDKDFSIGFAVYGPWLVKDTSETQRSSTYYDLLFAQNRFVEEASAATVSTPSVPTSSTEASKTERKKVKKTTYWPGGTDPRDGKYYAPGNYTEEVFEDVPVESKPLIKQDEVKATPRKGVKRFKFIDFPKTEVDLLKGIGADVAVKQIEAVVKNGVIFPNKLGSLVNRLEVDRGAIVAHAQSGVSYRNRFVWVFPIISGKFWKTFDVKDASGARNIVNRLFEFDYDASEVIWNNPNGSQAYMLFDGKGNRVEFADPDIVKEEPGAYRNVIRTPESCHNCHDQGINVPRNVIEKITLDMGARIDIKSREKDYKEILNDRLKAFFLTRLGREIKQSQEVYKDFVKECTSYDSLEQSKQYRMVLRKYRADVTLEVAARERGLDLKKLLDIARYSPNYDLNALIKGTAIPRETWDAESYREHVLLEDALRKKVNP